MRIRQNLDRLCFDKKNSFSCWTTKKNVARFKHVAEINLAYHLDGHKKNSNVQFVCVLQITIAHFFSKKTIFFVFVSGITSIEHRAECNVRLCVFFCCMVLSFHILTVRNFCVLGDEKKKRGFLNAQDSAIITNNKDTLIIVPLVSYALVT